MDINNKRIIITGASSGIGKETLLQFLKYTNVKIFAVDLNKEQIPKHDSVMAFEKDISKPENIESMVDAAKKWMGGIDIFFANAGFAYYEKISTPDWNRIEKIYKTNVFSPIYTLTYLNSVQNEPVFYITTASAMSHLPLPGYALYSATKASVHSFMEAFRYEMNSKNHVMVVYPIATRTKFFDTAGNLVPVPFPSQSAETVAKKIISGIKWNKKRVYPSFIFSFIQLLDRFLFIPLKIYQWIEGIKLRTFSTKSK
jgi:uncharacterized protein